MNIQEQFATMFAAIDAEGQNFILDMLEGEYERVQNKRRPVLRVIEGGNSVIPISASKRARRTK